MKSVVQHFVSGWDACYPRGLLAHDEAEYELAAESYLASIDVINRDKQFQEDIGEKEAAQMIENLELYLELANTKEPLRVA